MATEKRFQVGIREKHEVRVINSRATDTAKIFIDGKKTISQTVLVPKIYDLEIGNEEKHRVTIRVGGSLSSKIDFYVDMDSTQRALLGKEVSKQRIKTVAIYVIGICIAVVLGLIIGWLFLH